MNRKILYIAASILAVSFFAFLALRSRKNLEAGLPPKIICRSQEESAQRAAATGTWASVAGTGSMRPYIPAAPAGHDPKATVVAYIVYSPIPFSQIQTGNLCLYRTSWSTLPVCHCAAQLDSGGWIMSGLGNAHSEASERMTAANYIGQVTQVFTW